MYTVFSIGTHREHLGDALLVSPQHLSAAIDALVAYWELERAGMDLSVHCEVHHDSVRDARNYRPLFWTPGEPVIDTTLFWDGRQ
jgi:hypothetical protein